MKRRSLVSDALKRHGIEAVPDDREVNCLSGKRFEEDMGKTLKEEAEEWCRANDAANCVDVWLAGYKAAQPRWISVKERLPEEDEFTLIISTPRKAPQIDLAVFSHGDWKDWAWEVTHWMPIPLASAPEEQDNE